MDLQESRTDYLHRRRSLLQQILERFNSTERNRLLASFDPSVLIRLTDRDDLVKVLTDFESWGDDSLEQIETILRADDIWKKRLIDKGILIQLDQLKVDEGRNMETLPPVMFTNRGREFKRIDDNNTKLMQTWLIDAPVGYGKSGLLSEIHRRNIHDANRNNVRGSKSFLYAIPRDKDLNIASLANELIREIGCKIQFEAGERADKIGSRIAACILSLPIGNTKGQGEDSEGKLLFSEAHSSEITILIDNLDSLAEDTFEDLAELILGFWEEFGARRFFERQNRFRIFLAGRNLGKKSSIFRDKSVPFLLMPLSPFEFRYVEETVRNYTSQVKMPQTPKVATGIAAHIMYLTGGHPGAMANILQDLTRNDYAGVPRCLEEDPNPYLDIVHTFTDEIVNDHLKVISHFNENIVKFLPENQNLLSIIETLSVFRQYGTWLLDELITRKQIQWDGRGYELKDILTKTLIISKPISEPSSFLRNDISSRLLSMRLREGSYGTTRFAELCQLGLTLYGNRILRPEGEPAHILALEWLYQELQYECYVKRTRGDALKQRILGAADHAMDLLVIGNSSSDVIEGFTNSLQLDWELGFQFNYFAGEAGYTAQPFIDLEKSVEMKFKQILSLPPA